MRKAFILLLALTFFLFFCIVKTSAEDISTILVKGAELNNGVVILDIVKAGKAYELHCNQGMINCEQLKSGKYLMVELPKNWGIYVCKGVEIFPESTDSSEKDKKLGEYCLVEKS